MAGVPMPARDEQAEKREQERASLTDVMEMATKFFQERLQSADGAKARAYLRDRGLTPATQQAFRLGYAPDSRNALKEHLAGKGVAKAEIEACGLVRHGDDIPVSYDWFRDRIMFPIPDSRGRIIAFGGRALSPDALAKYMNSPETELFHKGNVLYNFARARKAHGQGRHDHRRRRLHGRHRAGAGRLRECRRAARHRADRKPARAAVAHDAASRCCASTATRPG